MNTRQITPKVSPRLIYLILLSVLFAVAISDHLTSPALSNLGAPVELGIACAPCGAPCVDAKPKAN
jgi:predicted signal transduction protein with EAL and GGDEF domain